MARLILLWLVFSLITGCQKTTTEQHLQTAERIVNDNPDSSLSIIQAIDLHEIKTPEQKALYGLLLTQAKDKCQEDISNDTLIEYSIDYYSKRNDIEKEMLSKYYLGRIRYQQGKYTQCIILSLQSLELANQLSDNLYKSLSARSISDSYHMTYNSADALKFAEVEFEAINQEKKQPYLNYALYDLASAFISDGQYSSGAKYSIQVLDSARLHEDTYLMDETEKILARAYVGMENYEKAIIHFENLLPTNNLSNNDLLLLGTCYLKVKQPDKAGDIIEKAKIGFATTNNFQEELNFHQLAYKYYLTTNNIDSAMIALKESYDKLNALEENKMAQSLSSSIIDYYDYRRAIEAEKNTSRELRHWLIISLLALIIISVSAASYIIYKKQKSEINRNIEIAIQIQESLDELRNTEANQMGIVRDLLSSKYQILDKLSHFLYSGLDKAIARRRVSDTVMHLLDEIKRSPKKMAELEDYINSVHNNIVHSFKKDFPNLKHEDYAVFVYSIVGFSQPTIATFLNEQNVMSVYNRKKRLKQKIKDSNAKNADIYLKLLG